MKNVKTMLTDLLYYTVGCLIYSAAVTVLAEPNNITPGGVTGIATMLNTTLHIPTGIAVLIMNIPLLIIAFKVLGGSFILRTAAATFIVSVMLDFTKIILPQWKVDGVLASVFGGILMGFGLGIVMLRGATTGGVDIAAKIINRKSQHLSIGRLVLIMDAFVVVLSVIVYSSPESGLYAVISIFATSKTLDSVLYGGGKGNLIYIITKNTELPAVIIKSLGRGITILSAKGAYTGSDKTVLMCAVRAYEAGKLHAAVKAADPEAFMVITSAAEILGEGFKKLD